VLCLFRLAIPPLYANSRRVMLSSANEMLCVLRRPPTSSAEVEGLMRSNRVKTIASGELPDAFKFFFYAGVRSELHTYDKSHHVYSPTGLHWHIVSCSNDGKQGIWTGYGDRKVDGHSISYAEHATYV
jgi:hypothetical protein